MEPYAGIDVGATKIKAAVGTASDLLAVARRPTPAGPGGIDVTEAVLDAVRRACDQAGVPPQQVEAAGIGSIGPFDLVDGSIVDPANLPASVDRVPLTGPVSSLIESDAVYLHNDTTAAVIGERYASEENPADMVYLTISTGIGAGVAVDGNVIAGWDSNAGEVGHFAVDPQGRMRCGCGRDGHWEAYASGRAIPRYTRFLAGELDVATGLDLADDTLSAADVFAAGADDPLARRVIDRVGQWNAIGLANVVHAYAPLVVSVGGSVAIQNEDAVMGPMCDALEDLVLTNVPDVRLTALGEDAVLHGAIASAMTAGTGNRSRVGA